MRYLTALAASVVVLVLGGCGRRDPELREPGPLNDGGPEAGAVVERCRNRQCLVPGGTFMLGSPEDELYRGRYSEDLREVTLTHDVLYDQYETTQGEWAEAGFPNLAGTRANSAGGRDCVDPSCPAAMLTWFEAAEYANWRSRKEGREECFDLLGCEGSVGVDFDCTGVRFTTPSYYACRGYRLPTMAEFEHAARAGTTTAFYSGPFDVEDDQCRRIDHLMESAWYCANSENRTHPVGQKKPNAFGLFDMLGNVGEFAGSRPENDTREAPPTTDPYAQFEGDCVGMAGGFFFAEPLALRAATQAQHFCVLFHGREVGFGVGLGFRLVRSISPEEAEAWWSGR